MYGRNGCKARVVAIHILQPESGKLLGVLRAKVRMHDLALRLSAC